LLAPFAAALVGATFGQVLASEHEGRRGAVLGRIVGAVAIGLGAIVELVVIDHSATDLDWLVVPLVVVSIAAALALLFAEALPGLLPRGRLVQRPVASHAARGASPARIRLAALACGLGILLVGPAIWSVDTLGHPTSGTFPAGGPESASSMGGPGGMAGGFGGPPGAGVRTSSSIGGPSTNAVGELFGEGSERSSTGTGGPPSMGAGSMGGGPGGMFGGEDLSSILEYTEGHGGGTIAVDSQSGASSAIIEEGAEVAGIGGFSGKESSVSVGWLEDRIESGAIAWIYTSGLGSTGGTSIGGAPGSSSTGGTSGGSSSAPSGDSRTGSESAIDTVIKSCTKVDSSAYSSLESTSESSGGAAGGATLYKCGGS
jgi:hypothetical protein